MLRLRDLQEAGGLDGLLKSAQPVLLFDEPQSEDAFFYRTLAQSSGPLGLGVPRPMLALSLELQVMPLIRKPDSQHTERISLGRTSATDLSLAYPGISKYHAFFTQDARGDWSLTDAGSTNGTTVDRRPLLVNAPVHLRDGADLTFGYQPLRFCLPAGLRKVLEELE